MIERPAVAVRDGSPDAQAGLPDTSHPVVIETQSLIARYLARHPQLTIDYDPEWPSPCEIGHWFYADDTDTPQSDHPSVDERPLIHWQPTPRWTTPKSGWPHDFDGLEQALEVPIHPDFKALFSHWSATFELNAPDGHVSLLQLWNGADVDRYVENLIGHILGQRRARGPLTLFFACTEPDSELILSLHNESGAIVLEEPGRPPQREVAADLASFLKTLQPLPTLPSPQAPPQPQAPPPGGTLTL